MKLTEEQNYINDAMDAFGACMGFAEDDVTVHDAEIIRTKAEEIFNEAAVKFSQCLDELGYEQIMGKIIKKGKLDKT